MLINIHTKLRSYADSEAATETIFSYSFPYILLPRTHTNFARVSIFSSNRYQFFRKPYLVIEPLGSIHATPLGANRTQNVVQAFVAEIWGVKVCMWVVMHA